MMGTFWRRLQLLLGRNRATRELEEEMRLHRQLREESLQRLGHTNAPAEARRRFGNTLQLTERSRDHWGMGSLDAVAQDIRYALRRLRQRPGFTTAVVGILALGIGATTAMFSAVDAAMLRPLPFARPHELVVLNHVNIPFRGERPFPQSPTFDITDAIAMGDVFANVAAYASGGMNLADPEQPRRVRVGVVSGGFFATIGRTAARGRVLGDADAKIGAAKVVVLSWALWHSSFGGADMLGETIPLNETRYEVIGVMPPGFSFPAESDVWIPMTIPTTPETFQPFRGYLPSTVIARIASATTLGVAESRVRDAWRRTASTIPRTPGQKLSIDEIVDDVLTDGATSPLRATLVSDRKTALLVLLGTTGLLLLIACGNVTNLLLSHGVARARELTLRSVLGATRRRLIRQLLAESLVLSVLGTVAGVAFAPIILRVLRVMMPAQLTGLAPATLDLRVLVFAAVLALITGVLFGLWPAFGATRRSMTDTIKSGGGHGATAGGARRTQRVLVGAEIALAGVLLIGAGLMLRSFARLVTTDSGLRAQSVATLELSFAGPGVRQPPGAVQASRVQRLQSILAELRRQPGVIAAGAVNDLPLRGGGGIGISVAVEGAPDSAKKFFPRYLVASDGYFEAMGIDVQRGRTFASNEPDENVAVVSQSMARIYWPDVDPLGRTFLFGGDGPPLRVIGVVDDVREGGLEREPGPQMYLPATRNLSSNAAIVVRGAASVSNATLLGALRQAVRNVDPAQAVYNVRMMDQVIGSSMAARRANTLLIALFGLLAVLIAVLGVYAVAANAVAQRSRELGIRAALGATRGDLFRHVGNEMLIVVAGGVMAGALIAFAASRVMQGLVYGITVRDAAVFTIAPTVLVLAAVAATIVPARRAMRVEPVEVMREE
ncbi:MAG TPA: ABC transporter permease [Gemmatimonadaceae bacterium]